MAAQPDLVAHRLGAFRAFRVGGERRLKGRFAAAGLDLDKSLYFSHCAAQRRMFSCFFCRSRASRAAASALSASRLATATPSR
jgi:hypothetical protein